MIISLFYWFMFKWCVFGGVLLVFILGLGAKNQSLKHDLEVTEHFNQRLVTQEWDALTKEHLQMLDELKRYFNGRPNQWPVSGQISSPFGFRVDPFMGYQSMHYGIDIVAPHGTPIHAPAPGRVIFVGDKGLLGHLLKIEHKNQLITYYGHLSHCQVKAGEWVIRGQKIAEVGSTGRSTAPHLHYMVQKNGIYQDPKEYLE